MSKFCLLIFTLCVAGIACAQTQTLGEKKRPIAAVTTTTAPVIDGDLSDDAWKSAPSATDFIDRQNLIAPPDPTTAYILFDDKYIYVAYHCVDSRPEQINARETVRDHKYASQDDNNPNKEDNVTFSIDPYFTLKPENVNVFSVNAIGTRSAKIAGGRGGKAEWKGDWDAAEKRVADGYDIEMRIPWDIINHPSSKSPLTMGVNFHRFQDRTKVESVWSNIGARGFYEDTGRWNGVVVPQTKYRPHLSLLPYILPGAKDERGTLRSGIDARYTLTPDLTLVGSLNPDFNTIEGAVEGIQFSRRERFIPERRPFFLEGADYFNSSTRFNDIGALFYPRRIRSFDLGTKLYGKITPVDSIGFLNTTTFQDRTDTVVRYKRELDSSTSAGVFLSNKSSADDDDSAVVFDAHRRKGKFGFETQLGATYGNRAGGGLTVLSSTFEDKNAIGVLQYQSISNNFRLADGFVPYTGQRGWYGFMDQFPQYRHSKWRSSDLGIYGIWFDETNGTPRTHGAGIFGSLLHTQDWQISGEYDYAENEGTIDNTIQVGGKIGATNRFRQFGLSLTAGLLQSEPATFITPSASVRILKKLDVAYGGSFLNLVGHTEQHVLSANYEFSPTRAIGGRLVSLNSDTNWYVSFKNSGAKGTEFYFIIGDPNARRFSSQVQLKMVFAFSA